MDWFFYGHPLSHSHTLSISLSISLDMLNKFCFHVYAQNSLFIGENCNGIFWDLITLSCEFRSHRAGSQLKRLLFPKTREILCMPVESASPVVVFSDGSHLNPLHCVPSPEPSLILLSPFTVSSKFCRVNYGQESFPRNARDIQ